MDALDSKGLPIIVNDSDPLMAPGMTAHMLMSIPNSGHYRSINTFDLCELQSAGGHLSAVRTRLFFWAAWPVKGREPVAESFLERLADSWMAHMSVVTGA